MSAVEHLGVADDSQYLGKVLQAAATANGIVGIKVHWHQFGALHAKVASAAAQRAALSSVFPNLKHIWLTRTNKIAQAISYYRASRTNLWHRRTIGSLDPSQAADAQFDYREIDRLVALIHRFDASWSRYFAAVGITPLQIVYEDMVADFGGTVRAVLRHIGVNAEHIAIPTPTLQRQADALSEAWERQYRSIGAMFVRARAQHRKAARAGGSRLHHPAQMPEPAASSSSGPNEMTSRRLIAYEIDPQNKLPIVVASRERPWMQRTPQRFANRCLPMLIANQSGWHILNTRKIAVTWDGGVGTENLRVEFIDGETSPFVGSHFGSGILTWNIPYLFRTSPGFNLLVRGPANLPKDGVQALEGTVETDWADATFTMNWQMTRPHFTVLFDVNEPIALIAPQRRGELESFRPETRPISDNPALHKAHDRWRTSRIAHNAGLKELDSEARRQGWQKHYFRGTSPANSLAREHQSKLSLRSFAEEKPNKPARP
jgi:LPS sulfotransferase NodH